MIANLLRYTSRKTPTRIAINTRQMTDAAHRFI